MSDDATGREQITAEVSQIIEDAIGKIHDLFLVSDPKNGRRDVAAFVRWYLDVQYFHVPHNDQSKWPKGAAQEDIAQNGGQRAVEAVEAILRGELDPVKLRKASEIASRALGFRQSAGQNKSLDKQIVALLYNEYRDKYSISKAEFARRIVKLNAMTVPKAEQRGINGTNFNNVYRELSRLLEQEDNKVE
jgi:hypothetical protein